MKKGTTNTKPATETVIDEKTKDGYEFIPGTIDELKENVAQMEDHSRWVPGIVSKEIKVNPIPSKVEMKEVSENTGLSYEMVEDTVDGTSLYVTMPSGKHLLVRDCGLDTLYSRANIFGSALGRMSPVSLAETLNLALEVSKGSSLVLERYGKASAFHSDAGSGYCVMPISELINITIRALEKRFGNPVFAEGYNSHSFTKADWILPAAQKKLLGKYEKAMKKSLLAQNISQNWMPTVRLMSSDTADCSAILVPMFQTGTGKYIRLLREVKVRHTRNAKAEEEGLMKLEANAEGLYGLFEENAEAVAALNGIEIYNAANVVVGLCNKFRFPKKYGDKAREMVEQFTISTPVLSAFDVYLAMGEAIAAADTESKSIFATNMADQLATTLRPTFDWQALDVGGVVAWNGKEDK